MNKNDELKKLVKSKGFKTFWHCLDYLVIAGYPIMDAFGISLQEFGEDRIFSDIAFIRWNIIPIVDYGFDGSIDQTITNKFTIGLIDENNIHLSGLYEVYRKWLYEGKFEASREIEETCEVLMVQALTPFLIDYLNTIGKKHYGTDSFELRPKKKPSDYLMPHSVRNIN